MSRVFGARINGGQQADWATPSPADADQLGSGTRSVLTATDGNAANSDVAPRDGEVFLHVPALAAGDFVRVAIGPSAVAVVTDLPLPGDTLYRFSIKRNWRVSVFADGANATCHVCMAHGGNAD